MFSRIRAVFALAIAAGVLGTAACLGDDPDLIGLAGVDDGGSLRADASGGGDGGGDGNSDTVAPTLEGGAPDAASRYRAAILADRPIAYWRMGAKAGATVPDETGRDNDLVFVGAGHTLGVEGALANESDTAIRLDGNGALTAFDSRAFDFLGRKPFSLECWAKREPKPGADYFQHLIGSSVGGGAERKGYMIWGVPEPSGTDYARFAFDWQGGSSSFASADGPMTAPNVFGHVVASFDGTNARLSVNGIEKADPPAVDAALEPLGSTLYVGSDNGAAAAFVGVIDEVAIYDRALTTAEIARHRTAALAP